MIKNKLAKCCKDTGLNWVKDLPIVLMHMRMRKRPRTNLSHFEILFGRSTFMGMEGAKQRDRTCCKEMSFLLSSNICVEVKAAQGRFRGDKRSKEKELESKEVFGPRQPLKKVSTQRARKGIKRVETTDVSGSQFICSLCFDTNVNFD